MPNQAASYVSDRWSYLLSGLSAIWGTVGIFIGAFLVWAYKIHLLNFVSYWFLIFISSIFLNGAISLVNSIWCICSLMWKSRTSLGMNMAIWAILTVLQIASAGVTFHLNSQIIPELLKVNIMPYLKAYDKSEAVRIQIDEIQDYYRYVLFLRHMSIIQLINFLPAWSLC